MVRGPPQRLVLVRQLLLQKFNTLTYAQGMPTDDVLVSVNVDGRVERVEGHVRR